jgi:hypothetical protein
MNPFPPRGGGPQFVDRDSQAPAWKRLHRSPFFWVSAIFIAAAMYVYVMTGNLAHVPGREAQSPVPAPTP